MLIGTLTIRSQHGGVKTRAMLRVCWVLPVFLIKACPKQLTPDYLNHIAAIFPHHTSATPKQVRGRLHTSPIAPPSPGTKIPLALYS